MRRKSKKYKKENGEIILKYLRNQMKYIQAGKDSYDHGLRVHDLS